MLGPIVVPGSYQAKLTVGDWSQTQGFTVLADPRVEPSAEGWDAKWRALSELRALQDRAADYELRIDRARLPRDLIVPWRDRPGAR